MSDLSVHRLCGLRLACDFPFTHHLPPVDGEPDLAFTVATAPPPADDSAPASLETVWESPERGPSGAPQTRLQRSASGDREILSFPDVATFHLEAHRITAFPLPGVAPELVELRFLGPVLAYHLERYGTPVLHASSVVVVGKAVAFLATNHGGKSSLAAALMQRGHALLSDDLLPLRATAGSGADGYLAVPGYPQMRFWPADAERFAGRRDWPAVAPGLPKVRVPVGDGGLGRFHAEAAPLAAILIPRRTHEVSEAVLEPVPPAEAAMHLVRCSFLPRLVTGAGLQPARLAFLAAVVERVPVWRLLYPSGYEHLPAVAAMLEDL
jgi:hypothetical protein